METIRYVDQNNNVYFITPTKIKYQPITPEESSSGTYSGGEPADLAIKIDAYNAVKAMANDIISNKKIQTNQRRMLCSMLSINTNGVRSRCILARSTERTALENKLKILISQN